MLRTLAVSVSPILIAVPPWPDGDDWSSSAYSDMGQRPVAAFGRGR
jgi:hypothetical protein